MKFKEKEILQEGQNASKNKYKSHRIECRICQDEDDDTEYGPILCATSTKRSSAAMKAIVSTEQIESSNKNPNLKHDGWQFLDEEIKLNDEKADTNDHNNQNNNNHNSNDNSTNNNKNSNENTQSSRKSTLLPIHPADARSTNESSDEDNGNSSRDEEEEEEEDLYNNSNETNNNSNSNKKSAIPGSIYLRQ